MQWVWRCYLDAASGRPWFRHQTTGSRQLVCRPARGLNLFARFPLGRQFTTSSLVQPLDDGCTGLGNRLHGTSSARGMDAAPIDGRRNPTDRGPSCEAVPCGNAFAYPIFYHRQGFLTSCSTSSRSKPMNRGRPIGGPAQAQWSRVRGSGANLGSAPFAASGLPVGCGPCREGRVRLSFGRDPS